MGGKKKKTKKAPQQTKKPKPHRCCLRFATSNRICSCRGLQRGAQPWRSPAGGGRPPAPQQRPGSAPAALGARREPGRPFHSVNSRVGGSRWQRAALRRQPRVRRRRRRPVPAPGGSVSPGRRRRERPPRRRAGLAGQRLPGVRLRAGHRRGGCAQGAAGMAQLVNRFLTAAGVAAARSNPAARRAAGSASLLFHQCVNAVVQRSRRLPLGNEWKVEPLVMAAQLPPGHCVQRERVIFLGCLAPAQLSVIGI